jgi:cytochrome c oxidase subunit II
MKFKDILLLSVLALVLVLVSWAVALNSYTWLPPQAATEAKLVDNLFAFLVFLGSFIFLGVTGTIFYSVLVGQVSRFDLSDGPAIEGNVTLEVVWTAIPIVLVFIIAGYSYWTYARMSVRGPMDVVHLHMPGMEAAYAAPLEGEPIEEIEVHAKQWAWTFYYPDSKVTSSELHLPQDRRVRLAMQTEDVIHGFYVPAFRLKQDIIPYRTIAFEFTPIREGTYRLNDSQFSGTFVALMQADVIVEPTQKYEQWLSEMATHQLVRADNAAYKEFITRSKPGIKTGWATVAPAIPPMVNQGTENKESNS